MHIADIIIKYTKPLYKNFIIHKDANISNEDAKGSRSRINLNLPNFV